MTGPTTSADGAIAPRTPWRDTEWRRDHDARNRYRLPARLPLFQTLPGPRLKLVALMGEKLHFEPGAADHRRG
jgi:hypothetical protein